MLSIAGQRIGSVHGRYLDDQFSDPAQVYTVQEKDAVGKELFGLVAAGQLKINIHGEYPFTAEGVKAAQQDLVAGKTTGKLLIKVADE